MRRSDDAPTATAIFLVAVLALVYALVPVPGLMADMHGRYFLRAALHPFFHANALHLAVNCASCLTLYRRGARRDVPEIALSYVLCLFAYACALRPAIGISNVLCATVGLRSPSVRTDWWRRPETLAFFAGMLLMAVFPSVSATTHIASFALGFGAGRITSLLKRAAHDAERA